MSQTQPPLEHSRVVRDGRIHGGEPTISGSRTTVASIVISAMERGTCAGIIADYPHLTESDVAAALAFYLDCPDEVDPYIGEATHGA